MNSADFIGNTTFVQNRGSLYTVSSHITFSGTTVFENCSSVPSPEKPSTIKRAASTEISRLEGGAVTITFEVPSPLMDNVLSSAIVLKLGVDSLLLKAKYTLMEKAT